MVVRYVVVGCRRGKKRKKRQLQTLWTSKPPQTTNPFLKIFLIVITLLALRIVFGLQCHISLGSLHQKSSHPLLRRARCLSLSKHPVSGYLRVVEPTCRPRAVSLPMPQVLAGWSVVELDTFGHQPLLMFLLLMYRRSW